ncbi:MAG: rRNA adenine N(6)-methyltransferase family protein [Myxococcota bacterium]|nr:rRNA adenine N(6)-methyltransferase family protein [Myxococcota bacterium]
MAAGRRRARDERRRRLGQNFLRADRAEAFVESARLSPGEFVLEIGPGRGALTRVLLRRGARVLAVEADPELARGLPQQVDAADRGRLAVRHADFLACPLPDAPYRVVASLPFASTTGILERLLRDPRGGLERADLIVQWEVARKRARDATGSLRSVEWAPWWDFELGPRIAAQAFRPVPAVDAGVLVIRRRRPALLPEAMARDYARFVRARWPFGGERPKRGRRPRC